MAKQNRQGRRIGFLGLICLFFAPAAFSTEYLVKIQPQNRMQDVQQAVGKVRGVSVLDHHEQGNLLKIDLSANSQQQTAQRLAKLLKMEGVAYVVPNIKMHAYLNPNDPQFAEQWSHRVIKSADAWDSRTGSKKIVVAVIDTGINTTHEDLVDNLWVNEGEIAGNGKDDDGNGYVDDINGYDFRDNDANPDDLTSDKNPGHGTHCAGIVGAVGNNGVGVVGMNHTVSLMAVRFLGADGSGDLMSAAKAIDYAVNNGAHIISASWGATVPESGAQPIVEAIGRANDKGVIFIAAAANDGANNDTRSVFPANTNLPNMIVVAASQVDDTKPTWSNFGLARVHVSSPGADILSTLPQNKYGKLSGTSMATPLVSGLAALLLSASDTPINGYAMRALLQSTGNKVAIETACGCRIDAKAALNAIETQKFTVVPNALTLQPTQTTNFSAFGGKAPFTFASSNQTAGTIDDQGVFTAKALGETQISMTDADGKTAQSLNIRISEQAPQEEVCPLGDPMMCQLLCAIDPTLPFCP